MMGGSVVCGLFVLFAFPSKYLVSNLSFSLFSDCKVRHVYYCCSYDSDCPYVSITVCSTVSKKKKMIT